MRFSLYLSIPLLLSFQGCRDKSSSKAPVIPPIELVNSLDSDPIIPEPSVAADFFSRRANNARGGTAPVALWGSKQNPVVDMLSGFDALWTKGQIVYTSDDLNNVTTDIAPTSEWNKGVPTAVGLETLKKNVAYVVAATRARTEQEGRSVYFDDRRKQPYSVIEGLGPLAEPYRIGSGAFTTITTIPDDTLSKKYDDAGNEAGLVTSELGAMVTLVDKVRTNGSTEPSKRTYLYPRPYRLNENSVVEETGETETIGSTVFPIYRSAVQVLPQLKAVRSTTPFSDSGFVSGHTNLAYLSAYALAYAVPERFQELITRASELGDSRIKAGMHSPLDVMGGRVVATAIAASNLCDPAFAKHRTDAQAQARQYFAATVTHDTISLYDFAHSGDPSADRFSDWSANKRNFEKRLTYNFPAIGRTDAPMQVPHCAEALLETRLPYLTPQQRRAVLYTTGLASGFPVIDDPEGWGRLDLFAAADGYGALPFNVTVTMQASLGGFNAKDTWKNDISGPGQLTKAGTGTLVLAGNNSYAGGTVLQEGTLVAKSPSALGQGLVKIEGGQLQLQSTGHVWIRGNFQQKTSARLSLAAGQVLLVDGRAELGGVLELSFASQPASGQKIEVLKAESLLGTFDSISYPGLTKIPEVQYTGRSLILIFR